MNSDEFLVTGETGEAGHYTVHAFSKKGHALDINILCRLIQHPSRQTIA
jgi:hypothetical protein